PLQPYTNYSYSTELQSNVADLWWTINEDEQEITFELHIKTTGWVALGISPAGGMNGADIGLGWVDQQGQVHFQDRYAMGTWQPIIDNTTTDWFALRGREENGWTAIQFKRSLDTCDEMDVAIKSGTNNLIFAYGLVDPDMSQSGGLIYYHENRRGSRIIPLRSYSNPPPDSKFSHLDYVEFKLSDQIVPALESSYHCKIFKVPTDLLQRRHAIAHRTIIEPNNRDLVHHFGLLECDPTAVFDDNNLPNGICDDIIQSIFPCFTNVASIWAVGGDEMMEYPEIGGYPIGGDFEIKYYMLQMHYDNPKLTPNRRDSSGVRFYLGNELRQHELSYLSIGAEVSYSAIAIPPGIDRFLLDCYCSSEATQGDELATRCVYSTTDKSIITLGGERTKDEMCLHYFLYYPRMKTFPSCLSSNSPEAWTKIMNISKSTFDNEKLGIWLKELKWTPELLVQWQKFFNEASRTIEAGYLQM
ncbi:unnamed protein product, partial [Didymodactylos carnosus]